MKVSVIVPTYNRADLLGRTIRSILDQTYQDLEIIIVDDGSTDETRSVIDALIEQNTPRIKYHRKDNGGCASARNRGLELASGDLIAFLDSDDVWLPDALKTMVSALQESNADFVYSPAIEVYEDGHQIINIPVSAGTPETLAIEHFKYPGLRNGALLFTKKVFAIAGTFDESLMNNEDSDFFQRVAISCKAAYSETPTIKIFHHGGNKSNNRVEINRALLTSAEKILSTYPAFAVHIAEIADRRLSEIKSDLVSELIRAGDYDQAKSIAVEVTRFIGLDVKLALLLRSSIPLSMALLGNKILGKGMRLLKKVK